eukprot:Blabericola_migrator_1__8014@NODE_410_length_8738_cov_113_985353_g323_i0_p4_GENE_NODE_410_length_8738_cov_113_985353_g323_i0NODE_410_length_8738_cov_113_985353_g323_i0_p4_ORF_typecomplete_len199_score47_37dCMP_cyt_deam_1/PF00383_23/0_023_NODE_410_length_8738_cov_113_985353_g323_i07771373
MVVERLNEVGETSLAKEVEQASPDDLQVSKGQNTEVMTKNWKRRRPEEGKTGQRWKVLHAEIVALLNAAKTPEVLDALFAPQARKDVDSTGSLASLEVAPAAGPSELVRRVSQSLSGVSGCVGVVIAELDDNSINLDSSQACPLCIKALKRWGLGEQIYTTDMSCLLLREKIQVDELLVAESLQGALCHYGQSNVLLA